MEPDIVGTITFDVTGEVTKNVTGGVVIDGDWILATGEWSDTGVWNDESTWID